MRDRRIAETTLWALLGSLLLAGVVACRDRPRPRPPAPTPPPVTQPTPAPPSEPVPELPEEPQVCPIEQKVADEQGCYPCAKPQLCPDGHFRNRGRCCPDGALDPRPPADDGPGEQPTPTPAPPSHPTPEPPVADCEIPEWSWCQEDGHPTDLLCHVDPGEEHGLRFRAHCRSAEWCQHLAHGDGPGYGSERDPRCRH